MYLLRSAGLDSNGNHFFSCTMLRRNENEGKIDVGINGLEFDDDAVIMIDRCADIIIITWSGFIVK